MQKQTEKYLFNDPHAENRQKSVCLLNDPMQKQTEKCLFNDPHAETDRKVFVY